MGTCCTPHEPRLVEILVDVGEGGGAELIGVTLELAFEELVAWGTCCSPPVEEIGHRPDRIPQRCERAACAGIHVGSKHPPDLRHGRNSRLFDHGSEIVFDDLHPTGARSGKTERLTQPPIEVSTCSINCSANAASRASSSANVGSGFASTPSD